MILKFRGNDPSAFDAELGPWERSRKKSFENFPRVSHLIFEPWKRAIARGSWFAANRETLQKLQRYPTHSPIWVRSSKMWIRLSITAEPHSTYFDWLPSQGIESALSPVMLRLNQEEAVLQNPAAPPPI